MELLENQLKQYNWEQDQINHMKVCKHCSSKEKNRHESCNGRLITITVINHDNQRLTIHRSGIV